MLATALFCACLLTISVALRPRRSGFEALPHLAVWVASDARKIRPSTPPEPNANKAELSAARNEVAALQLIVTAHKTPVRVVDIRPSDLKGSGGSGIPLSTVSVFREALLKVETPSLINPHGGERGLWPDALVPVGKDRYFGEVRNGVPFDVPADSNQPVWVEFHVPRGARAGDYTGTVSVVVAGADPVRVPVRLHVWSFEIPSTASLPTAFGMAAGTRIRHHLDPAATTNLIRLYEREALAHRITLTGLWASNGLPDYEYDPAHPERGAVIHDWGRIDDYYAAQMDGCPEGKATSFDVPAMVNLRTELPPPKLAVTEQRGSGSLKPAEYAYRVTAVNPEGETEGSDVVTIRTEHTGSAVLSWNKVEHARWPMLNAIRYRIYRAKQPAHPGNDFPPTYFLAETSATTFVDAGTMSEGRGTLSPAAGSTGDREALALYREYAGHLRKRGWLDRAFCYAEDEPFTTKKVERARKHSMLWRKAVPNGWSLVTNLYSPRLEGAVNLWCVVANWFDDGEHGRAADVPRRIGAGQRVWWYQSDMSRGDSMHRGGAWPSVFVDDDAMAARVLGFYSWRFGFDGFLYYLVDMAYQKDNDPWKSLFYFNANGDGTLFFPGTPEHIGGKHDIPVASLRLAFIRQGLQDYEYLKLAADLGDKPFADREAARLVQAPDRYNGDAGSSTVESVRVELGRRIEKLSAEKR